MTGSPDFRVFIGFIFEPSIGDRDGDGIKDDVDKCPDDPEDFDDFEDEDGCPDPDNDKRRHPRRRRQVPERARDQERLPGRGRLPRQATTLDRDGDGILDDVDKCPDEPEDKDGFEDEDGCPDPDNDKDGILDVDDLCPNEPEDKDGFEDEDGCPDPDNDKDGILDVDDKCPNEPETYNGFEDEDGCPDKGRVIVPTRARSRSSTRSTSRPTRRSSSPSRSRSSTRSRRRCKGNPQIQLIEIQGHADERGDDDYNLRADRGPRARPCKTYLDRARASTPSRLQCARLRRDQAALHAAQRGLLGEEPPRRVHHPAPHRLRPAGRMIRSILVAACVLASVSAQAESRLRAHQRRGQEGGAAGRGAALPGLPAELFARAVGVDALAKKHGFVVAHAGGVRNHEGQWYWNATPACCDFDGAKPDDVGYLMGIIDELVKKGVVDPKRVYLAGFSNGGFLAYRLACEHADKIAAIVSVGGGAPETCKPSSPVSVLDVHGTADKRVPVEGWPPKVPSRATRWRRLRAADQCDARREGAASAPKNAAEQWLHPGGHVADLRRRLRRAHVDLARRATQVARDRSSARPTAPRGRLRRAAGLSPSACTARRGCRRSRARRPPSGPTASSSAPAPCARPPAPRARRRRRRRRWSGRSRTAAAPRRSAPARKPPGRLSRMYQCATNDSVVRAGLQLRDRALVVEHAALEAERALPELQRPLHIGDIQNRVSELSCDPPFSNVSKKSSSVWPGSSSNV